MPALVAYRIFESTGDAVMCRRTFFFRREQSHIISLAALLLAALSANAHASRPPLVVPTNPTDVLERLPRGYVALMPAAHGVSAFAQIQALLSTAARTGDARLAARADAMLARLPSPTRSPEIMIARAYTAQHRHDFSTALRILDAVIGKNPRNGSARMSRAQVQLVQGRLDRARTDCAALAFAVDAGQGQLCIAALSLRTGAYAAAGAMTDQWLAQPGADAELLRNVQVMRGEIASRSEFMDADRWFQRALAQAPDDVRTLAAYARHLRARGRHREAVLLLAKAPGTDGLRLQLALAAHSLRLPQAAALIESQGRRYALARAVGSEPELRDEAEFLLTLRGDANAALALAQRNFQSQRDFEDVDILRRAAAAAHRPDVLATVDAWEKSQQIAPSSSRATRR